MAELFKKLSLVPMGLRYKLTIAFVLMSIIPLAICVYLATTYIFPILNTIWDISIVILITILIALLGGEVTREIVTPIVDMAIQARVIAKGDINHEIQIRSEDEIGELGNTLNILTRRIRENMDELRSYGERTREINVEIGKKVLVLSSLLQIGNLISQEAPLNQILELIIGKASGLEEDSTAFLMLIEDEGLMTINAGVNLKKEDLKAFRGKVGVGVLGKCVSESRLTVLDRRFRQTKDSEEFLTAFGLKNCILGPVVAHGRTMGVISCGNSIEDFEFKEDDVELLKLFAKQAAIAIENEVLVKRARALAIKDELTGLYNEKFITNRLAEEIKRAIFYQRPCSFVIFNIDDLGAYRNVNGQLATEEAIKKIGKIIEANIGEIDRIGRLSGDEFAVILPEKNKKQANAVAEILRQRVEAFGIVGGEGYPRKFVTVSGGVSENPIDGVSAEDLVKKARAALSEAKLRGKNTVV